MGEATEATTGVGIVLGAGGPLGWAYHLGVLDGVREALGRDPADADRIVGTSAGAAIAATAFAGRPIDEVLELITTPPSEEDRERMREAGADIRRSPLRFLRPMAPRLAPRIGRIGLGPAVVGLLPAGRFPTLFLRRFGVDDGPWPESLWVPSVRLDDGEVVVFGRDETPATLADAIEATQAVPGLFQPKTIGGSRYVDGAVASSTHADLIVPDDHDVVVVSAPMVRPGRGPVRARARRSLDREVRRLRDRSDTPVLVLPPGPEVLAAAEGFPRQNPGAGAAIVAAARAQTLTAFADAAVGVG